MKNAFFLACFCTLCACNTPMPASKCTLDGKSFKIENYVNGQLDGTERLSFRNGQADNDQCTQYGFGSGNYTCEEGNKFKYSLYSEKEGRMDWEGQVTGKLIAGKMVWVKTGQQDIYYTFQGEEQ